MLPAKKRTDIPRGTRDQVLSEFHHRCAVCAKDRPQLHHIDGDPSNNDPLNIIPLCPNCHLTDQHNPTAPLDPRKLALFRRYKDPAVLKPQFEPLFRRMIFLDSIQDDQDAEALNQQATELTQFIFCLEMGAFYSRRIQELLRKTEYMYVLGDRYDLNGAATKREMAEHDQEYREALRNSRAAVKSLVVEMLRFQKW